MRRMLKKVLAIGLIFSLTACGHYFETDNIIDNTVAENQSIKENNNTMAESQSVGRLNHNVAIDSSLSQTSWYKMMGITTTTDGYYCISSGSTGFYVTYYDIKSDMINRWCNRADCKHSDTLICTSLFENDMYKRWIMAYEGSIYQMRFAEDGGYLMKRNLDGSNLTQVAKLWDFNAAFANVDRDDEVYGVLIHSGYLYYLVTEDYAKMAVWRTALDGSVSREVVYEWTQEPTESSGIMKSDADCVYIYGFNRVSDSFIVKYEPSTDELEEIYRKTVDGQITGIIKQDLDSFFAYDGGMLYVTKDKKYFRYDTESEELTEYPYYEGAIHVSHDGEYVVISNLELNEMKVFDLVGNELLTVDIKEYFPAYKNGGVCIFVGVDSRCFLFDISFEGADGIFALDRSCVETGKIEFKQIAYR